MRLKINTPLRKQNKPFSCKQVVMRVLLTFISRHAPNETKKNLSHEISCLIKTSIREFRNLHGIKEVNAK
jgi:hypothetical protein